MPATSKIIINGVTEMDVTQDNPTAATMFSGVQATGANGEKVQGSYTPPPVVTAGTPVATKSAMSNNSIDVTPSVTNPAGTIAGGTETGDPVTVSASEVVSGTLPISQNGEVDVTNYQKVNVQVASGGKVVQAYRGYATVTSTSYTATAVSITVKKTGTYDISWMGYRNTNSGTSGSQLYKNGTAVGSASTTFVNTYGHSVSLTNQSLSEGDVLVVRARARSASYVMGVGNLIIEEV